MQSFRAAVIQTASVSFDAARSIDKLDELVRQAAAKGAKLALLPEAFIGGIQGQEVGSIRVVCLGPYTYGRTRTQIGRAIVSSECPPMIYARG